MALFAICTSTMGAAQSAQEAALVSNPSESSTSSSTNDLTVGPSSSRAFLDLPDAPQSTQTKNPVESQTPQQAASATNHQDVQTKRILGIVPNFRAVSADVKLPPQSVKEKFITATQDTFDYSALFLPALLAAYGELNDSTPEFHGGAPGYARYFWHSYVDQADENYWVEFIVPSVFHEDTRYYTMGKGGFVKRAKYSLGHIVVTRDDAGKTVFNAGEVLGAGASAGVSNLYYPSAERSVGHTMTQWAQDLAIDALTFTFKEFWPDINHKLFHGQQ